MKKLLIILMCLLMLCGCNSEKQSGTMELEENELEIVGGWYMNPDLPALNDAYFDSAMQGITGVGYSPILLLGSQVVNGTNYAYLTYATTVTPNASSAYKVVIINVDTNDKCEVLNIADFVLEDYRQTTGSNTSSELVGGFVENDELSNMLDEELNAVFTKAFDGWIESEQYEGICLLASQVVAGTNYAFLAKGTGINGDPNPHLFVVTLYEALDGSVELSNICGIDLNTFNN